MSIETVEIASTGLTGIEIVEVRQGPAGADGTGTVNNATVNAAIEESPGTTRTSLELGNAATLTVDADLATFSLPASTTISAFGATLVDDASASTARTTLGLGTAATTAATDYATSTQGTKADAALPRTGGTMTGDINLGFKEVTNCAAIRNGVVFLDLASGYMGDAFKSLDWAYRTLNNTEGNPIYNWSSGVLVGDGTGLTGLATSTQGTKADAALPRAGGTMTGTQAFGSGSSASFASGSSAVFGPGTTAEFASTSSLTFASGSLINFTSGSNSSFYSGSTAYFYSGSLAYFYSDTIKLQGTTYQTSLNFVDPASAKTITFPDDTGTVSLLDATETLTNKTLTSPTLTSPTVTGYTESVVAIGTVTTTNTISLTSGTVQTATLTASTACEFTLPTPTAGRSFVLYLKQAATTGLGTATWAVSPPVKWAGGTAPTITATAGKMDILSFVADGTNWYGSAIQNFTP